MTAGVHGVRALVGPFVDDLSNGAWAPSPSPDGSRAAFVSDRGGSPQAWISGPMPFALPTGSDPVTAVHWSPDGDWIACEIAPGGAPRTELWIIRPDGSGMRQIAGFGVTTVLSAGWVPVRGSVEFAVTEIGDQWRCLLIDPRSNRRRRVAFGQLVALLDVSRDGTHALLRRGPRGRRQVTLVDLDSGEARLLLPRYPDGNTERAKFSVDGSLVYLRTDADSELARLVAVPVDEEAGPPFALAERADADLEDFHVAADGRHLALLWNVDGRSDLVLVDPAGAARVRVPPPGEVLSGCAISENGRVLLVCAEGPGAPRALWHVDVDTAVAEPVGALPVSRAPAVAPELHRVPAGDGFTVSGWCYRPDRPGPHPTMISLHPGPEAQERPGHHPIYQQLAARGIAVFAPNVRGSSGYGRTFVNADNLAGRHGAIADVAACARYLVDAGLAPPGGVGVMGRSYGGYLTLAALVTNPELFAVGVEVCGMSDLLEFYAHTEAWIAAAAVSKYGHPVHDAELLAELSPLRRIDRLAAPLMVVHGANDTNVPVREAEQLVAALHARDLPHRYLYLPGEGHEFVRRESRKRYLDETVAWVAAHLCD